jgi:ABC-type branched-subunit amino acid transport system substrate-binding protein
MTHTVRQGGRPDPRRSGRAAVALSTLVIAVALAACSSTESSSTTTTTPSGTTSGSSSSTQGIPSSAFSDTTGLTSSSVSVGNVSTLAFGLFKGADVGTEAWADYVNSTGGINGRKLVVDTYDDGYQGAPNKQATQEVVQKDFAAVGGFSLEDSYGGSVLAANPGVPNVTVNLDQATGDLPNSFSPDPAAVGWPTGPLLYFKQKFPQDVQHAGALVADQPSAITKWNGEKAAMESLGYKVPYDQQFDISQTDFTQNVVAMRQDGIKILFLEQMPENYAAAVVKALNQQDYHPQVVFGASTYSEQLVPDSGGASAVDGAYMEMVNSLFLGEDENVLPAAKTFQTWVQKADPGFHPDLYTLFGWLSGQLFTQALQAAGAHPTRGSVLEQLKKITVFNGNYLIASSNPAAKIPAYCYVIAQIHNGVITRVDDPPVNGPQHGYRCDGSFYYYPPK